LLPLNASDSIIDLIDQFIFPFGKLVSYIKCHYAGCLLLPATFECYEHVSEAEIPE